MSEASLPRLSREIDIRKLLPAVIADDEAGGQFLDGPRGREAAGGHSIGFNKRA